MTIARAALSITADDKAVTYGDEVPTLTVTLSPAISISAEDRAFIVGKLMTDYTSASPAGTPVEICWSGGSVFAIEERLTNYTVTIYGGEITVGQKALTITVDTTQTYSGLALTYYLGTENATGLVAGDSITAGALTTTSSNVKDYTVQDTDWTVLTAIVAKNGISNYDVSYNVSMEITKKNMNIAVGIAKTYDGQPWVYQVQTSDATGLVAGDAITAGTLTTAIRPSCARGRISASAVSASRCPTSPITTPLSSSGYGTTAT